jgi:hypothetical protein
VLSLLSINRLIFNNKDLLYGLSLLLVMLVLPLIVLLLSLGDLLLFLRVVPSMFVFILNDDIVGTKHP